MHFLADRETRRPRRSAFDAGLAGLEDHSINDMDKGRYVVFQQTLEKRNSLPEPT